MSLASLHRYPVKSCRGESLRESLVEPWGLSGDRRWMVVDETGAVITAREVNRMVLIEPAASRGGLVLTAPDVPALTVPPPDPDAQVPVDVWGSRLTAAAAGGEADAWFSKVLGRTARLVHLDDPTRRATSPAYGGPDDRVSFADAFPLLLVTQESLAAINDAVLEAAPQAREPLPVTRFRPNVVVTGAEAWAEDDWRRIRIGEVVFRAVKGCDRCVMTTIDPDTAEREKEPIASLARVRRWDGKTWFGINLVPDTVGATIRVGDEVEVLESVPPGGGPLRSGA